MPAARGDRKPCTVSECPGTMQFRRKSEGGVVADRSGQAGVTPVDPMGWVCTADVEHFRLDS